jgi:hypothetical integral membrane protein (TIGR02206 family)
MGEYFSKNYDGGAFELFGPAHLIGLGCVVMCCVLLFLIRKKISADSQKWIRWGLLGLIYGCEGSWQIWMFWIGDWTVRGMLPLWLCSLTAWSIPLLLVWRNRKYYEWVYFMGLLGASQALLTPDLMSYGFPHFRFIEFFCLHGAIIVAVIYMTVVEGFRPTWRSLPFAISVTNVYWAFCGVVNYFLNSNYLYTNGKLPTPSLLDFLGPWPWYLLAMEGIGIMLSVLLYVPFALSDGLKARENH